MENLSFVVLIVTSRNMTSHITKLYTL